MNKQREDDCTITGCKREAAYIVEVEGGMCDGCGELKVCRKHSLHIKGSKVLSRRLIKNEPPEGTMTRQELFDLLWNGHRFATRGESRETLINRQIDALIKEGVVEVEE